MTFNYSKLSSKIKIQTLLLFALFSTAAAGADGSDSPSRERAEALLKAINKPYEESSDLSYIAERTTTKGKDTLSERWMFAYNSKGNVRIEFTKPNARIIIKNSKVMWEYIPAMNAAVRTDLSKMTSSEKVQTLRAILQRVAVPGLRPGNYKEMLKHSFTTESSGDIITFLRKDPPRFRLKVDSKKCILLLSETYNMQDQLEVRTIASKHVPVKKGFWMPQRIKNTVRTGDTYITSSINISKAKADASLPEDTFKFDRPKKLRIIRK